MYCGKYRRKKKTKSMDVADLVHRLASEATIRLRRNDNRSVKTLYELLGLDYRPACLVLMF